MSGYMDDYSRSNRAADAEGRGLRPKSRLHEVIGRALARKVAPLMVPSEWHHTGCKYRRTDYYDATAWLAEAENVNALRCIPGARRVYLAWRREKREQERLAKVASFRAKISAQMCNHNIWPRRASLRGNLKSIFKGIGCSALRDTLAWKAQRAMERGASFRQAVCSVMRAI